MVFVSFLLFVGSKQSIDLYFLPKVASRSSFLPLVVQLQNSSQGISAFFLISDDVPEVSLSVPPHPTRPHFNPVTQPFFKVTQHAA